MKVTKKLIALLLSFVMIISLLPMQALATDGITEMDSSVTTEENPCEVQFDQTYFVTVGAGNVAHFIISNAQAGDYSLKACDNVGSETVLLNYTLLDANGAWVEQNSFDNAAFNTITAAEGSTILMEVRFADETVAGQACFCAYYLGAGTEEEPAFVDGGVCGDNLKWSLDSEGTLTISGEGAMTDYSAGGTPWFAYVDSIQKVVIEDGVTSIGAYAFSWCSAATTITVPDSVTSIGERAFYGCESLTSSITIPDGVTDIGGYTFFGCSSLTGITIPDSVTSIGAYAFYNCSSLPSVTIPNSVTSIGKSAFSYCSNLASVTVPDSVTSIGAGVFSVCDSLTEIVVSDNNQYYCSDSGVLFNKDKTELLQAPGAISGSYAVPDSVTNIADYAFYYCADLTDIVISDSVTSIGMFAFDGCESLTSVAMSNNVTSIGDVAFRGTNIASITIPDSVTSIGIGVFASCNNLSEIVVGDNNQHYCSDSGVLFNKDKTELIQAPGAISGSYEIPESVNGIGQQAFFGCANLTDITIPNSVTSIGNLAFRDCASLTSITFNGDAPILSDMSFWNVTATVYYPAGNETWTADVMQNYGGTITWEAYTAEGGDSGEIEEPYFVIYTNEYTQEKPFPFTAGREYYIRVDAENPILYGTFPYAEAANYTITAIEPSFSQDVVLTVTLLDENGEVFITDTVTNIRDGSLELPEGYTLNIEVSFADPSFVDGEMMVLIEGADSGTIGDEEVEDTSEIIIAAEDMAAAFPDANFRACILENVDTNGDGQLSANEIANTTEIVCCGLEIHDLTGIEYFTNLVNLDCSCNNISRLDLSQNTKLEILRCYNFAGEDMEEECIKLTELDLSSNSALKVLDCYDNALTELDLSACTELADVDCSGNDLKTLNLTGLTKLETLWCGYNAIAELDVSDCTQLKRLTCYSNCISTLDVSNLTSLEYLWCQNNDITELDVTNLTSLVSIECSDNRIPMLDLSNNAVLGGYYVRNQFVDIVEDSVVEMAEPFEGNNYAVYLPAYVGDDNLNRIVSVCDRNGDPALLDGDWAFFVEEPLGFMYTYLVPTHEDTGLTEVVLEVYVGNIEPGFSGGSGDEGSDTIDYIRLDPIDFVLATGDLSDLTEAALSQRYITDASNGQSAWIRFTAPADGDYDFCAANAELLENEAATDTVNLEVFKTSDTSVSYCPEAGVDIATRMTLAAGETVLMHIWFTDETLSGDLVYAIFACGENVEDTSQIIIAAEDMAAAFPDANFRAYILENVDANSDGQLSADEIANTTYIGCSDREISDLTGIGYFTNLVSLNCQNNNIADLDLAALTNLQHLYCSNNRISVLDVAALMNLATLQCYNNNISVLDVAELTNLRDLNCSDNRISVLDVSKLTELAYLYCAGNSISVLDVSGCAMLEGMNCGDNAITKLDLSGLTQLHTLDVYENPLDALDVSNNTLLRSLNCSGTGLTALDISALTELECLYCSNNALTALDLSKNTNLWFLDCGNNQLTSIDLSNNPRMEYLEVPNNKLTALDLSSLTNLVSLYAPQNPLTALNLSANTLLETLNVNECRIPSLDLSANVNLYWPQIYEQYVAADLTCQVEETNGGVFYTFNLSTIVPDYEKIEYVENCYSFDAETGLAVFDYQPTEIYYSLNVGLPTDTDYTMYVTLTSGCVHDWQKATCTEPQTCSLCGATRGDVSHDWMDPTCTAPWTCADCGAQKGEAAHDWVAATCQNAKYCTVCKETVGDVVACEPGPWTMDENGTLQRFCLTCGEPVGEAVEAPAVDSGLFDMTDADELGQLVDDPEYPLSDAVLAAGEDAKNVFITLTVEDITDSVAYKELMRIADYLGDAQHVGAYFDIDLYKHVDGVGTTQITETENWNYVRITLQIPEELVNTEPGVQREFFICRFHDDYVEDIWDCEVDEDACTITFLTNRFSTYAIAYDERVYEIGSREAPVEIETAGTYQAELTENNGYTYYHRYYAPADGYITVDAEPLADAGSGIHVINETIGIGGGNDVGEPVGINASAGDEIIIENYLYVAGAPEDTSVSFTLEFTSDVFEAAMDGSPVFSSLREEDQTGLFYNWVASEDGTIAFELLAGYSENGIALTVTKVNDEGIAEYSVVKGSKTVVDVKAGDLLSVNVTSVPYEEGDYWVYYPSGAAMWSGTFTGAPVAQIGTVEYATVSEALADAKSGDTVTMIADSDESDAALTIYPGVTLDIGSYELKAGFFTSLKGSYVTAKTVDANGNGGRLVIKQDNISLSVGAPVSADNATANVIPVWNKDHYIFTMARIRASGDGLVISEDGNTVALNFATTFSGYVRNLLNKNGSAAHDLSIVVTAKWENAALGADLRQEFVFNDDMVKAVSASSNNSYYATLGGCNSKSNLVLQLMIVTDCGVVVYSTEYPVNIAA